MRTEPAELTEPAGLTESAEPAGLTGLEAGAATMTAPDRVAAVVAAPAPAPVTAPDRTAGPARAAGPLPLLPTLVRLGGLPAAAVPRPGTALVEALEGLRRLDEEMERVGDRLLDPLYRLIPDLERKERRAVLHAKRKVFQGRVSGLPPQARAGLPADVGAMLAAWDDLVAQRHAQYTRLEAAVASDLDHSRTLLADGLDDAEYLRALAIAAPALVAALTRRGRRLDDSRVLRTLYTMATRTALKTSPFSGLTTVAEAGRPARGRRRCTVALHLAYGIVAATARDLDPAGLLRLEAAPVRRAPAMSISVAAGESGDSDEAGPGGTAAAEPSGTAAAPGGTAAAQASALAIVAEHGYANAMVFRRQEVQPARWLAAAHDRLTDGRPDAEPVSVREAARLVGGRDPRLRLRRLLFSGAVHPRAPWSRGADPLPALAATLSEAQQRAWGEDLGRLERLERLVETEDGPARAELLTDVQRLAQRIFSNGELGAKPGGLLYEDCESRGQWPDPMELEPLRRDIETLTGLVDPWVTRSHIYDLMVRRFVSQYGRGGVCEDPLFFLMTLAHAPDGDTEMMGAVARDISAGPDPERAAMPGGVSASPRHMGAYLQPVLAGSAGADGSQALGTGGLTVVNAFTNGNGSLQTRFHRLLGDGYRERLARGVRTAWGLERVLEIEVATDCNTAQAVACGVLPPLGLPGEPAAPDAVPLSSLRLAHDPPTDTLFLSDDHGPVGVAYLGLIPQYRLGGYMSWLALLGDPWARMAPFADHRTSRNLDMTGPLPDEVIHSPRASHGRLVTRRESWTFPASRVTELLDRDLAATLVRVARLRDQWGIPAEIYVHQHMDSRADPGATFDEHKPRYVDLRSPVSLLSLHGWIDPDVEHLTLVEALPTRDELVGTTPDGEATVLEYLIGMQWPKWPKGSQGSQTGGGVW